MTPSAPSVEDRVLCITHTIRKSSMAMSSRLCRRRGKLDGSWHWELKRAAPAE